MNSVIFQNNTQDQSSGHLLSNLLRFGRFLRTLGIPIAPSQLADLARALDEIGLQRRVDVKATASALLVSCHEHLALFDLAFDLFWQARDPDALAKLDLNQLMPAFPAQTKTKTRHVVNAEGNVPPEYDEEEDRTQAYSANERLRKADFAHLSDDELAAVKALMQEIAWHPPHRRIRRQKSASTGHSIDMRRTWRASLRHGGEPLRLHYRTPQKARRPLVILCDVSGSMERYARLLLQFIYTVSHRLDRVESFAFSTRLTHLTRQLRRRGIDAALDDAVRHVHDWGGGTRIGAALHEFNFVWGRRVLSQGAIVLIISDGWDRGDVELLGRETARLQRTCHQLLWLNPRLGAPDYAPLVRGIQAALPHIDAFLPVHNLASLEQLANVLDAKQVSVPGEQSTYIRLPGQRRHFTPARNQ